MISVGTVAFCRKLNSKIKLKVVDCFENDKRSYEAVIRFLNELYDDSPVWEVLEDDEMEKDEVCSYFRKKIKNKSNNNNNSKRHEKENSRPKIKFTYTKTQKATFFAVLKPFTPVSEILATVSWLGDSYKNIKQWRNGGISGKRCAKNIIDDTAIIAGAFAGRFVGATIGSIFGPPGPFIGM